MAFAKILKKVIEVQSCCVHRAIDALKSFHWLPGFESYLEHWESG